MLSLPGHTQQGPLGLMCLLSLSPPSESPASALWINQQSGKASAAAPLLAHSQRLVSDETEVLFKEAGSGGSGKQRRGRGCLHWPSALGLGSGCRTRPDWHCRVHCVHQLETSFQEAEDMRERTVLFFNHMPPVGSTPASPEGSNHHSFL